MSEQDQNETNEVNKSAVNINERLNALKNEILKINKIRIKAFFDFISDELIETDMGDKIFSFEHARDYLEYLEKNDEVDEINEMLGECK